MKRSEVNGGQGAGEREYKRPRAAEESSKSSDFNPFLVEPILRKLLKKVDTVAQLKELRKMCVLWDNVNMEELEERAFKGKLKVIDFEWTERFGSNKEAEKELIEFLDDTRLIPRLFCSFKVNIPESLKILQNHIAFFSDYTIFRVELAVPWKIEFEKIQDAMNYFLKLIGPNLKEIQIPYYGYRYNGNSPFEPKSPNWHKSEQELVLTNLEKLIIKNIWWDKKFANYFKSVLGNGSSHITSLVLVFLPGNDIGSFPGLDPARMTRLEFEVGGFDPTLIFTTGLMTLVEKGMKLKNFGLRIFLYSDADPLAQSLPRICFIMTQFFAIQSQTLSTLHFQMDISVHWPHQDINDQAAKYGKIQLPVFQALHTLDLDLKLRIETPSGNESLDYSLFETTFSLPLHFPSLVNVIVGSQRSFNLLCEHPQSMELVQASLYHFKRLELPHIYIPNIELWNLQYAALIASVEYLKVPAKLLEQVRIPWTDSLRELTTRLVSAPLKLTQLKKLETLIIEDSQKIGYEKIVQESSSEISSESDSDSDPTQESVFEYLNWFREATELVNLTYIKFIGLNIVEDGIKEEFIKFFPFPVQFQTN